MNSIFTIRPYLDHGQLVFDDPQRGLLKEPFVGGADTILIAMAVKAGIKDPRSFTLIFSAILFPGFQEKAEWIRAGEGGRDWYNVNGFEGWLCPSLLKYFQAAPKTIYFQIKE